MRAEVRWRPPEDYRRPTVLRLREAPPVPVEAGIIMPSNLCGKSRREIEELRFLVGNREEPLGRYFAVEAGEDAALRVEGDLSRFKRVGAGMDGGLLHVVGPVGPHAGAQMRSGLLVVEGTAGDWLGAHLEGGKIVVLGDAGHRAGAAYCGYATGMKGGLIIISGRAGQMVGARMRRGIIAVGGGALDFAGYGMRGGTLLVCGEAGERVGATMRRGTAILFSPCELLPTFRYGGLFTPLFWLVLKNYLDREGFRLPEEAVRSGFHRFTGDHNELGKGEVLIWAGTN
ncbi:MAG: formylmethanofuran dehydrogenase subunit C [Clostridia bacterium]|jgi:formylmethanofuran dehydrogenase subunit C|nr:formylmethanofuran dehydrogenase subunit C [Clostridia bacterium]MDH7572308.1 formylmethanofuran dehydrogenase subunit C [Clostridia bacterium]